MAKKPSAGTPNGSGDNAGEPIFIDPASATNGGGGSGGTDNAGTVERDATGAAFDATIHVDPGKRNADGSYRRKRGRKAGSGNSTKKIHSNLEASIDGLTKGLAIFHTAIAVATKTPEMVLDDEEAKGLATATVNVLDLYDIRPDPKVEAIVALIGVSAATYIPRIAAIKMRRAQEEAERAQANTAGVWTADGAAAGTTVYTDLTNPDNRQNNQMN